MEQLRRHSYPVPALAYQFPIVIVRIKSFHCTPLGYSRTFRRAEWSESKLNGVTQMNKLSWMFIGVALAAPVLSLAAESGMPAQPDWPAGVQDKNDPTIMAFYDGQCARYADRNDLTGDERQAFVSNCRSSISAVFPVGYAGGGDGGGDE